MKPTITIIISMVLLCANAQDSLLLMNGKIILGKISKVESGKVYYSLMEKTRLKSIETDDLFSISYNNLGIKYFYSHDTTSGNFLTRDEMYTFLMGQNYARENYRAPLSTAGGVLFGITGGVIGFWGMTIPCAYVFISGIKEPGFVYNEKLPYQFDIKYIETEPLIVNKPGFSNERPKIMPEGTPIFADPLFKEGYIYAAKDRKVKNAIIGGVAGFVSLVVFSYILVATGN